jgi:8-oxo-dGTP diphosphatase
MTKQKLSEQEFLANYNVHDFDVPLTSVDLVIFTVRDGALQVLFVKRGDHPFKGKWALPGGFINLQTDVDLDAAALRKLQEKTGVNTPYLEQLQGFGNATRDPRGWSTTFAYFALIASDNIALNHGGGADAVHWFPIADITQIPSLAFDHATILQAGVQRLRNKVEYTSIPAHLLPAEFTLTDLQQVYQIVLGRDVDKSAFRKRVREGNFLAELPGQFRLGSNRPAQLYRLQPDQTTVFFNRAMSGR